MASREGGVKRPTSKGANAKRQKAARATATKAAAAARRAGAVGRANNGAMDRHKKALRDTAILSAHHAQMSTKQIAAEFGITQRAVQAIIAEWGSVPSPLDQTPMQIVEQVARTYRRQILDFDRMAHFEADRNPNVALGAMNAAAAAVERYVAWLRQIGKMPTNLELFRAESEMTEVGRRMRVAIERLVAGELTPADVLAEWDRLMTPTTELWSIEGTVVEDRPQLEP